MRILGIESSSLVASVAIVEDGVTMAEYTANFKKTKTSARCRIRLHQTWTIVKFSIGRRKPACKISFYPR